MITRLVTIATFDTPEEANIARNRLVAEDISAFLADEAAVGMAWHLGTAIGGVKLRVAEGDVDRAMAMLDAPWPTSNWSDESEIDQVDGLFETEMDEVEEESTSLHHASVARAFRAAVIGTFFIPLLLYSLWLLVWVAFEPGKLNSSDRRRVAVTLMIDFLGIAIGTLVLWAVFSL